MGLESVGVMGGHVSLEIVGTSESCGYDISNDERKKIEENAYHEDRQSTCTSCGGLRGRSHPQGHGAEGWRGPSAIGY